MQSVPITTDVVSSNLDQDRSVQHYVIRFISDLRFSPDPPVTSTNKTDRHDITEILLKVALSTIKLQSWKNNESALFLVCVLMSSLYI
jgi:hypothetical protein